MMDVNYNYNVVNMFYDMIANEYDHMYDKEEFLKEDLTLSELLTPIIGDGSVLEIGCGTGHLLELLQINSERYLGIDPSEEMIVNAKKKFPKYEFKCGSVLDISQKYDTVVAIYGVASYMSLEEILKAVELANNHFFLMFYKDGYVPHCYRVKGCDHLVNFWKSYPETVAPILHAKRMQFTSYEVVTNDEDI